MNYFQSYAGRTVFSMPTIATGGRMAGGTVGVSAANPSGSFGDPLRLINEGVAAPILDGLRQAATNLTDSFGSMDRSGWRGYEPVVRRRALDAKYDCGCGYVCDCSCAQDTCHCKCCIVDADLVIYARLGERRIVPISIDNRWRRERKIELNLGEWSTHGGSPAPTVQAELQPKVESIELPPCGSKQVLLVVSSSVPEKEHGPTDVDDCRVFYADLSVQGCEIRPVRIALALLPLDCGPYRIHCGCRCC